MKKAFAAILAMALLCGVLVGCNGQASSLLQSGQSEPSSSTVFSRASSPLSSSSSSLAFSYSQSELEETPETTPNIPYFFADAPPVQVRTKALAFKGLKSFGGEVQNSKELFYVMRDTIENSYWECSGEPGTLYYSDMNEVYKVMEGVFAVAGADESGLYLVKRDESIKQLSNGDFTHEHRASLVYYNPVTQSSKTLIKGVENAILAGVNNEIMLYTRFVPYESEYGDVRLEIVKYEVASGKETIVFQDDFEEWYDEGAAQSALMYEQDAYVYIDLLYPYPSDGPLSRTIKFTKNGGLLLYGPPRDGDGLEPYPEYIDCGTFTAKIAWENYEKRLWVKQNGQEILLAKDLDSYGVSQTGLLYYSYHATINGNYTIIADVYNGVEMARLEFVEAKYPTLLQAGVIGGVGRTYLAVVIAENSGQGADSCFMLYEATGTGDNPLNMKPVLRLEWPGSENDFVLSSIWPNWHGIFTIFTKIDGSYVLLNTLTGQCLTYNMQGMKILQ